MFIDVDDSKLEIKIQLKGNKICNFLAILLLKLYIFCIFVSKYNMIVQEKLRNLRKLKNISQQEMAKIIGTDASNYSRKERGEVRIFDDEWEKIASVLGVSAEDLKNKGHELANHYSQSNIEEQQGNGTNLYYLSELVIQIQKKYISMLEKEVESLKAENKLLKSRDQ